MVNRAASDLRKIKIKTLNPCISCKICKGYLIDATTVTECLHTFCKSCLVKHLEESGTCPACGIMIHQSHPLQYISFDRTLQDVVYKLVPHLQQSEIKREKQFYAARGMSYPKIEKSPKDSPASSSGTEQPASNQHNFHQEDEQIGIELLPKKEETTLRPLKAPFIRVSAAATITHLKKFIALHQFKTIDRHKEIDILYDNDLLGKDHTLKFVFVTRRRFLNGHMQLYYQLSKDPV